MDQLGSLVEKTLGFLLIKLDNLRKAVRAILAEDANEDSISPKLVTKHMSHVKHILFDLPIAQGKLPFNIRVEDREHIASLMK